MARSVLTRRTGSNVLGEPLLLRVVCQLPIFVEVRFGPPDRDQRLEKHRFAISAICAELAKSRGAAQASAT